jgi:hypothetical protein
VIDPRPEIEQLAAFAPRRAGSDAERRAANHLAARMSQTGRQAGTEPTEIWPRWPLTHLIHALAAIAGSALSVEHPLAGLILVELATASTIAELTNRLPLTRRITGRRASQNVLAKEESGKPGTLILTAHYDAARGGAAYGRLNDWRARRNLGFAQPFVASLLVLLATSIAREAGADDSTVLNAVQFVPTVILIVYLPFLADILLSGTVPGANDNASGVATVMRLAERYSGRNSLDHLDLDVLLTGGQETGAQGMHAWLKRHRSEYDSTRTIVINVDEVGAGTIRYATKEGPLIALKQHPRLVRLCDQISDEDTERRYGAEPTTSRTAGDAYAARSRGIPAITISCAPAPHHHRVTDTAEHVDPEALDRAFRFCSELIELIDEQVGPDIAASAEAQAAFTHS